MPVFARQGTVLCLDKLAGLGDTGTVLLSPNKNAQPGVLTKPKRGRSAFADRPFYA